MMKSLNDYKTTKQNRNERMFNFYKIYGKEVTPFVEKYEKTRIIELSKFSILATLITAFTIFFIFVGTMTRNVAIIVHSAIVGLMLYGSVLAGIYYWINHNFQKKVKQDLLQKVLRGLGDIYWISEKEIIGDQTLEKSELFGNYNKRRNDDTFQGKYKDLNFKISESVMKYETGSGRNRRVYTIFQGVIILIDSNKKINAQTIITTKGDKNTRNSTPGTIAALISSIILVVLGIIMQDFFRIGIAVFLFIIFALRIINERHQQAKKMSNITLEDPEFNKKYDVFTQDQIEGRYLVTTSFMERFKNLHTAFGTTRAKCAFFDNKVMFALSTGKNLFELSEGIFCSLKNPKQTKVFYEEISAIYDIIDYFKFAEKTGL